MFASSMEMNVRLCGLNASLVLLATYEYCADDQQNKCFIEVLGGLWS